MSQITCCPACQTRFKVVADQLRISDGWVRCGNCKQVFDASLSLQPAAPEPMFPDMPLDQLRGPVARTAPPTPATRSWGSTAAERAVTPPPTSLMEDDEADDGFAHTQPGLLDALTEDGVPGAPDHIPAFLKAPIPSGPGQLASNPLGLSGQRFVHGQTQAAATVTQSPVEMRGVDGAAAGLRTTWNDPLSRAAEGADAQPASTSESLRPGGYELPAAHADAADSEWPALFAEELKLAPNAAARTIASGGDASEPDLAHFMAELAHVPEVDGPVHLGVEQALEVTGAEQQEAVLAKRNGPLNDEEDAKWLLVHEGPSDFVEIASPLQATVPPVSQQFSIAPHSDAELAAPDAQEAPESDNDLSFVRSARRRAFWSGKGVRVGLTLLATALLLALAGQVALRERARVAAIWPQSRGFLESACAYLQCSVGLYRDIGAVVVDGSSFNRAQGDTYQFSLTLRNRSALPVEAPAIELTLTDAQDQTVLRRILLPAELAIPNPIGPAQEWSTIVPMSLGQGAARVAGYRVLVFYP